MTLVLMFAVVQQWELIGGSDELSLKIVRRKLLPVFEIAERTFIAYPISQRAAVEGESAVLKGAIGDHPIDWHRSLLQFFLKNIKGFLNQFTSSAGFKLFQICRSGSVAIGGRAYRTGTTAIELSNRLRTASSPLALSSRGGEGDDSAIPAEQPLNSMAVPTGT